MSRNLIHFSTVLDFVVKHTCRISQLFVSIALCRLVSKRGSRCSLSELEGFDVMYF